MNKTADEVVGHIKDLSDQFYCLFFNHWPFFNPAFFVVICLEFALNFSKQSMMVSCITLMLQSRRLESERELVGLFYDWTLLQRARQKYGKTKMVYIYLTLLKNIINKIIKKHAHTHHTQQFPAIWTTYAVSI